LRTLAGMLAALSVATTTHGHRVRILRASVVLAALGFKTSILITGAIVSLPKVHARTTAGFETSEFIPRPVD
ncbi:MAG TPA: hypothetical protein VGL53_05135, partial [Bryobacteraceae bacterium]